MRQSLPARWVMLMLGGLAALLVAYAAVTIGYVGSSEMQDALRALGI